MGPIFRLSENISTEESKIALPSPRIPKLKLNITRSQQPSPLKTESRSRPQHSSRNIVIKQVDSDDILRQHLTRIHRAEKLDHQTLHIPKRIFEDKPYKKVQTPKATVYETVKRPNGNLFIKFSQKIYQLIHCLNQLKDYVNNQRRAYQILKHIIGNRKALQRIMIDNNEIVDMGEISKRCCIKEQCIVHGELRVIERFDLSLSKDLDYLIDQLEAILLQHELQGIKSITDQVQYTLRQTIREEDKVNKLKQKFSNVAGQNLSRDSPSMKRFQPHEEISNMEQRLGEFKWISKSARQTSHVLQDVIESLTKH